MKHAFVCAVLILGSAMLAQPAFATDPVMPPPVTDDPPPAAMPAPENSVPAPDSVSPELPNPVPPPADVLPQFNQPQADQDKADKGNAYKNRAHRGRADRNRSAKSSDCKDCPPPKRYDSQEVIKKIREIDHSRNVDTVEMAPTYPKPANGGIRVRSDKTLVVIVTHEYRVIESPGLVSASDVAPTPRYSRYRPHRAVCRHGYNRHGSCRSVLRVRG